MRSYVDIILIVDDNQEDLLVFKRYIKRCDFSNENTKVLEAKTVKEAIGIISSTILDCVLLDYKLPDKSGSDLLKALADKNIALPPIIMLTGQKKIELAVEALKLGAEDYLVKDEITEEALCRSIQNATEKNNLRRQLSRKEEEIRKLAYFDTLTDLPNRVSFEKSLKDIISEDKPFSVILLDFDRFKNINDTLGHDVGDLLIKKVAKRLQESLLEKVSISRVGGDEFVILRKDDYCREQNTEFLSNILKIFSTPFQIKQYKLSIYPSIGVANYPEAGSSSVGLMKSADIAMFRSKEMGGNQFSFYTSEIEQLANEKVTIENELRQCIKERKIKVVFQPIINLDDELLFALESLIRFENRYLSGLNLEKVIRIAEHASLMVEIGSIFMDLAFGEYKKIVSDLKKDVYLTINLSSRQLEYKTIKSDILTLSKKHQVSPQKLIFELTESAFINNMEKAELLLQNLVELGSRIYIDDFGTGFSSLSLIQKLPISGLKIDKSFVINMEKNPRNAKLVNSIIMLALTNGLEVTAEGVETFTSLTMLKLHPNVKAQGFYISRPVESNQLGKFS